MARGPLPPRRRGGQHVLGAAPLLLRVQPVRRGDPVGGHERADDPELRGEEGVDEGLPTTQALQELGHPRGVEEAADAVGHAAQDEAHEHRRHGPRQEGRTLQPPRQPPRRRDPALGGAGAVGQHAGPEIPARAQHEGQRHQDHRGHQRQDEQAPAGAREGPDLLAPADRRQPRQPPGSALGQVTDCPGDVGNREHDESQPGGRARTDGQLGGDPTDGGEQQPGRTPCGPERDAARQWQPRHVSPTAVSTAIPDAAIAASRIPAASGAARPTTVDPTSSRRPVSSSALVCRTTRMIISTPTIAAPNAVILNSDSSPSDVGS